MAIDPKYLPEDPKALQRMVLDLMAQLDRESAERSKIENLLRELLEAKRGRKSEQLSADQLALFAAAWQAREEKPRRRSRTPMTTMMPLPAAPLPNRRSGRAAVSLFRGI